MPQDYPLIDPTEPSALAVDSVTPRIDPAHLAQEVLPIRDAFLGVLADEGNVGVGYGLKTVEVSLAITAEGSLGFIKGSATGTITLSFEKP